MTTHPELDRRGSKVIGLLALVLFGVMSAVFLTAGFGEAAGFPDAGSITAAIGYAMFNLPAEGIPDGTEGFLVSFIVIAVVLDAALDAAVMLATRDEEGDPRAAVTDGGQGPRAGEAPDDGGDR